MQPLSLVHPLALGPLLSARSQALLARERPDLLRVPLSALGLPPYEAALLAETSLTHLQGLTATPWSRLLAAVGERSVVDLLVDAVRRLLRTGRVAIDLTQVPALLLDGAGQQALASRTEMPGGYTLDRLRLKAPWHDAMVSAGIADLQMLAAHSWPELATLLGDSVEGVWMLESALLRLLAPGSTLPPRPIAREHPLVAYRAQLAMLDEALGRSPADTRLLRQRAEVNHRLNRLYPALEDLERALASDPQNTDALGARGEILRLLGRLDEALDSFERVLARDPSDAWVLASRGQVRRALGDRSGALADLEAALQGRDLSDGRLAWARGELDSLRHTAPLLEIPISSIRESDSKRRVPGQDEALQRAAEHLDTGELDEAFIILTGMLDAGPADSDGIARAYALRGEIFRRRRFLRQALDDFSAALDADPLDAFSLGSRGQVYRAMGQWTEAQESFAAALELQPGLSWVGSELQTLHEGLPERVDALKEDARRALEAGDLGAALQAVDKALVAAPHLPDLYAWRGEVRRRLRDYDRALADLNEALLLDTAHAWAVATRGQVHRALGNRPQARTDFRLALERDPNLTWARAELMALGG